MIKTKQFDCVEIKHKAAEKIYRKLNGLSKDAQISFWKSATIDLKKIKKGSPNLNQ
jgi:hypothetical protein